MIDSLGRETAVHQEAAALLKKCPIPSFPRKNVTPAQSHVSDPFLVTKRKIDSRPLAESRPSLALMVVGSKLPICSSNRPKSDSKLPHSKKCPNSRSPLEQGGTSGGFASPSTPAGVSRLPSTLHQEGTLPIFDSAVKMSKLHRPAKKAGSAPQKHQRL